ncbi:hypothetical protein [Larkinella terrae]|uniref:Uncharacterized protein n=1 Tax=Larkinella terrae TaxID=2025311 RepID=A0A7K0EJ88_9BACT|nr:hypothetical protein [Larkinella terrae]MRS61802.1 hypothetical protein [Larkinella terrae]
MKTITITYQGQPYEINAEFARQAHIDNYFRARTQDDLDAILEMEKRYLNRLGPKK